MDATFHFRQKIGCALAFHSTHFCKLLEDALAHHPWFFLAPQHEAQIVWSDRLVSCASPQQRVLYVGFVEGVEIEPSRVGEKPGLTMLTEAPIYIPSASAQALVALLKPLENLGGIGALQVTALLPPDPMIPSMALLYQTNAVREERFAQPLKRELAHLLGTACECASWIEHSDITGLYVPVMQGPFLSLTVQTERPLVLAELMSQWRAPSARPATPFSFSIERTPTQLASQEPFVVYQDAIDAPYVRMQRESCLIGQLCVKEKQVRVCVVPPDPVFSLLASTEALVMSGAIYW